MESLIVVEGKFVPSCLLIPLWTLCALFKAIKCQPTIFELRITCRCWLYMSHHDCDWFALSV